MTVDGKKDLLNDCLNEWLRADERKKDRLSDWLAK